MTKHKHNPFPIVAIVGKVNVGKSTLFNRLIEKRKAIVSKVPGTTRDRNYGECRWQGKTFLLIDTGGLTEDQSVKIQKEIQEQTEIAIKEADLIVLVVDIQEGVLREDKQVVDILRKSRRPVVLVLNKADNPKMRSLADSSEFFKLGLGKPWLVSALNGSGTGDLLDEIISRLPPESLVRKDQSPDFISPEATKISIIGRPNVGKSSFVNAVMGEKRVIVSDIPHTTREPHDTPLIYQEKPIILVDTAGIRKTAKIKSTLEKKSVAHSLQTINKADVILFMVEANVPIGKQDKHLAGYLKDSDKGVIAVINKWDLVPLKNSQTIQRFIRYFQINFPFLRWAPFIFISAKTGQRVNEVLELALKIKEERAKQLEPEELYKFLKELEKTDPPPEKILGFNQIGIDPPRFTLNISKKKEKFPMYYLNVAEKRLREKYGFIGTPVKIVLKERELKKRKS